MFCEKKKHSRLLTSYRILSTLIIVVKRNDKPYNPYNLEAK